MNMSKDDFSKLGFDSYESGNLSILMNLKTADEIKEWMEAVGDDEVRAGLELLAYACEMQLLNDIDNNVSEQTEFPEVEYLLSSLK
jgi:hypothetical protein